jgi:hypothetical protein
LHTNGLDASGGERGSHPRHGSADTSAATVALKRIQATTALERGALTQPHEAGGADVLLLTDGAAQVQSQERPEMTLRDAVTQFTVLHFAVKHGLVLYGSVAMQMYTPHLGTPHDWDFLFNLTDAADIDTVNQALHDDFKAGLVEWLTANGMQQRDMPRVRWTTEFAHGLYMHHVAVGNKHYMDVTVVPAAHALRVLANFPVHAADVEYYDVAARKPQRCTLNVCSLYELLKRMECTVACKPLLSGMHALPLATNGWRVEKDMYRLQQCLLLARGGHLRMTPTTYVVNRFASWSAAPRAPSADDIMAAIEARTCYFGMNMATGVSAVGIYAMGSKHMALRGNGATVATQTLAEDTTLLARCVRTVDGRQGALTVVLNTVSVCVGGDGHIGYPAATSRKARELSVVTAAVTGIEGQLVNISGARGGASAASGCTSAKSAATGATKKSAAMLQAAGTTKLAAGAGSKGKGKVTSASLADVTALTVSNGHATGALGDARDAAFTLEDVQAAAAAAADGARADMAETIVGLRQQVDRLTQELAANAASARARLSALATQAKTAMTSLAESLSARFDNFRKKAMERMESADEALKFLQGTTATSLLPRARESQADRRRLRETIAAIHDCITGKLTNTAMLLKDTDGLLGAAATDLTALEAACDVQLEYGGRDLDDYSEEYKRYANHCVHGNVLPFSLFEGEVGDRPMGAAQLGATVMGQRSGGSGVLGLLKLTTLAAWAVTADMVVRSHNPINSAIAADAVATLNVARLGDDASVRRMAAAITAKQYMVPTRLLPLFARATPHSQMDHIAIAEMRHLDAEDDTPLQWKKSASSAEPAHVVPRCQDPDADIEQLVSADARKQSRAEFVQRMRERRSRGLCSDEEKRKDQSLTRLIQKAADTGADDFDAFVEADGQAGSMQGNGDGNGADKLDWQGVALPQHCEKTLRAHAQDGHSASQQVKSGGNAGEGRTDDDACYAVPGCSGVLTSGYVSGRFDERADYSGMEHVFDLNRVASLDGARMDLGDMFQPFDLADRMEDSNKTQDETMRAYARKLGRVMHMVPEELAMALPPELVTCAKSDVKSTRSGSTGAASGGRAGNADLIAAAKGIADAIMSSVNVDPALDEVYAQHLRTYGGAADKPANTDRSGVAAPSYGTGATCSKATPAGLPEKSWHAPLLPTPTQAAAPASGKCGNTVSEAARDGIGSCDASSVRGGAQSATRDVFGRKTSALAGLLDGQSLNALCVLWDPVVRFMVSPLLTRVTQLMGELETVRSQASASLVCALKGQNNLEHAQLLIVASLQQVQDLCKRSLARGGGGGGALNGKGSATVTGTGLGDGAAQAGSVSASAASGKQAPGGSNGSSKASGGKARKKRR